MCMPARAGLSSEEPSMWRLLKCLLVLHGRMSPKGADRAAAIVASAVPLSVLAGAVVACVYLVTR